MLLDKQAILDANDLATVDVEVPQWGGTVRLRMMTGSARDEYEQRMIAGRKDGKATVEHVRATLLAYTLVGEDGELLFSADDIAALGRKSAAAMDKVFAAASKLNAVSADDVEELAGN